MIRTFRRADTQKLFNRERVRKFQAVEDSARRNLEMIHAAGSLDDLKSPPGNRLEKLHADREGQYGIRINDQWRVCFVWRSGDAYDVQIVDYH